MPDVVVRVPVRIEVDSRSVLVADLAAQVAAKVAGVLATAARTLAADGHHGRAELAPATVMWSGDSDALSVAQRSAVAARIAAAVDHVAKQQLTAPAARAKPAAPISVELLAHFHTTPRAFYRYLAFLRPDIHDDKDRYLDVLDARCDGIVLRVHVNEMMFLDELYDHVFADLEAHMGGAYLFGILWNSTSLPPLVALDGKALAKVSALALSRPVQARTNLLFGSGAKLLVAVVAMPRVERDTVTAIDTEFTQEVALRDLTGLVDQPEFYSATGATWASYVHEWGEQRIAVTVRPFIVKRPTQGPTLRALYADDTTHGKRLIGGLRILDGTLAAALPAFPIAERSNDITLALAHRDPLGDWQRAWCGAYFAAYLPDSDDQLDAARYLPAGRVLAREIVQLLTEDPHDLEFPLLAKLHGAFGSGHGRDATLAAAAVEFGYFLDALDEIAPQHTWVAKLYAAAEELYDLLELLVRFGHESTWAGSAPVRDAIERIDRLRAEHRNHVYEPHRVKIDGKTWLYAIGVPAVGGYHNLGDITWLYTSERQEPQLKKSSQLKVGKWMLDAAVAVTQRLVDDNKEISTDEYSQQILAEVQSKITAEDVEMVTLQRTLRLFDVIEVPDAGITRHRVQFYWIERVKGSGVEWKDAVLVPGPDGNPALQEMEDGAFEELLFFWQYRYQADAMIAFAKGVTYLSTFVVAWEAGAFELMPGLLGFTAASMLIYIGKTIFTDETFSLDGLMLAGIEGYAAGIGFGLLMPVLGPAGQAVGKWVGSKIGIELIGNRIAALLLARVANMAVVGGGSMVALRFVTDIVMIALGKQKGLSSWGDYFKSLGEGTCLGIVIEFAAGALGTFAQLSTFAELRIALRQIGEVPRSWFAKLDQVGAAFEKWATEALARVRNLNQVQLVQAFKDLLSELKMLAIDAPSLRGLVEFSKTKLTPAGRLGLERMIELLDAGEAEQLLLALRKNPATAAQFLESLGAIDPVTLARLANGGRFAALLESPKTLRLMRETGRSGVFEQLAASAGYDVAKMEAFLDELDKFTHAEQEMGFRALGAGAKPGDIVERLATSVKDLKSVVGKLYQSPDEVTAELNAMYDQTPPGQAPPVSRPSYKDVKKLLRTTETKDPVTRATVAVHRGPYEGYVELDILRKNIDAYRRLRDALRRAKPDVILGTERGGEFIADVLEHGDSSLAGEWLRPAKTALQEDMYPALRAQIEKLIGQGKRSFIFVDAYMGGFNAEYLVEEVFEPLLDKYGAQFEDLEFGSYWIREQWGLETGVGARRYRPKQSKWASRISDAEAPVPWIFGDDVNLIMGGAETKPVHIFDDTGHVIQNVEPTAGETTRDLVIRLLNGEGLGGIK